MWVWGVLMWVWGVWCGVLKLPVPIDITCLNGVYGILLLFSLVNKK